MNSAEITVAIVGATGAVGSEVVALFQSHRFLPSHAKLRLFASPSSVNKEIPHRKKTILVETITGPESFQGITYAIFCCSSALSKKYMPYARKHGCIIIDNSSAFRMDDSVPLVVPEINPQDLDWHDGIIANPNCSTAILAMGLWPLHKKYCLRLAIVSTYQAVSGAGAEGVQRLDAQLREHCCFEGRAYKGATKPFPYPIACNVIPGIGNFNHGREDGVGYSTEELKMQDEGSKIMDNAGFKASVTCVRVPVVRAHSLSVVAQFSGTVPNDLGVVRALYDKFTGVKLCDDVLSNDFPTPLRAEHKEQCLVGRIRHDIALPNALSLFICGDQLLKGAALNAVQIMRHLIGK